MDGNLPKAPSWLRLLVTALLSATPALLAALALASDVVFFRDMAAYAPPLAWAMGVAVAFGPLAFAGIIRAVGGSKGPFHPVVWVTPIGLLMILPAAWAGERIARRIPERCVVGAWRPEIPVDRPAEYNPDAKAAFHLTARGRGNPDSFRLDFAHVVYGGAGPPVDMSIDLEGMLYYLTYKDSPHYPLTREALEGWVGQCGIGKVAAADVAARLWSELNRWKDGTNLPRPIWEWGRKNETTCMVDDSEIFRTSLLLLIPALPLLAFPFAFLHRRLAAAPPPPAGP